MRSILILLGAIGLLVVGFVVYFSLQTGSARPEPDRARASLPLNLPPATQPAEATVAGPGEDVWVKSYDEKTGQLAFQFRASRYTPRPDGAVDVIEPQAELFMGDDKRQVVRIEGATGRVVMQTDVTQRGQIRGTESAAPRRGELHDVLISLFDESDLARPLLVCKVNNIAFDNDTFRIATEGYDDGRVLADQVPVEVRGEDFDFDGRGLTIRWNETDRRLQLLEIAHGESLTIKSPQLLGGLDQAGRAEEESAPATKNQRRPAPKPNEQRPSPPAKPGEARQPPVYRAAFDEAVRVTQAEAQIATADRMLVDFVTTGTMGSGDRADGNKGQARSGSTAAPTTRHAVSGAALPHGERTQSAQPLVVHWIGKLRVTALEGDSPRPAPGSINIAMSAENGPVLLNHRGMKLACSSFDYRSGDDSLSVTSSKEIPMITLEVEDGTTVRTPSIVYRGADSKATLRGAGEARIATEPDDKAAPEMLQTNWTKSCELTLARGAGDRLSVESATLDGDVNVDHPRLALRSDRLQLGMGAPDTAGKPVLKDLTASGAVQCKLIDPNQPPQDIRCDQLAAEVAPMDGAGFTLKAVTADGSVVVTSDESQLSAGHLTLTLIPVKRAQGAAEAPDPQAKPLFGGGDVELQALRAQKDVKLKLRDGATATADQLDVEQTLQGMVAVLLGQPTATLSDGTNTLTGPNIKIVNDSQELFVYGPGTLRFDAREQPDEPARPVQVAWNSGLAVHARANEAQITGGVSIASDASDGSRQRATAERVIIALADAPEPATTEVQASARREPGSEYFDAARGKTLRSITLSGDAQVQSVLDGSDESQVRRMHLLAPEVRYHLDTRRAEVPSAGRMLVQDTRDRDASSESQDQPLGDFRGATAFQWSKDLVLDQSANQMTMAGSVLIVHQNQSNSTQSFRLEAQQVVADLLPAERPATTAPSDAGAVALLGPSDVRLKSLTAEGDIRMFASQVQVEANSVFYDALRNLLTARGRDRMPVQVYNDEGVSRGSFAEIVWNTRTEQIERMRQVQVQVRP